MVSFFSDAFKKKTKASNTEQPRAEMSAIYPSRFVPVSALVDVSTRAVLAVNASAPAISFLNKCTMDTYHIVNVSYPNYLRGLHLPLHDGSLAHFAWDEKARLFVKTRDDVAVEELHARSRLAIQKLYAATQLMFLLSLARSRLGRGIDLQETVFMTKKLQARAFADSGYDESRIMENPYVLQYADAANIGLKEAADDILLKSKLDDDVLAKTELMRLVYFQKLGTLTDARDIPALLEEFHRESYINSIV